MFLFNFCSKFLIRTLLPLFGLALLVTHAIAQTSPVGWMDMDATLRNLQLLGQLDPNISFAVRPIHYKPAIAKRNATGATIQDIFNDMDSSGSLFRSIHFDDNKGVLRILPTQFTFKNNSHHPFGWNDEAMIAAKGAQTVVSAGVYSRYGPVSVQFQPQWVRSQNAQFEYNSSYGAPATGFKQQLLLGQSSVLLHVGGFAAGYSTQNLWFGPGQFSSLLISNNAPGFGHFTFGSTRPICLPIGSFEVQIILGRLDEDSSKPELYEHLSLKPATFTEQWRYLNSAVFTFQPSFFKNFHIGAVRSLQVYQSAFNSLNGRFIQKYLPVLTNLFKKNGDDPLGGMSRDQLVSLFARWVFPKSNSEFYFEYGWSDHKGNLRDLVLGPTHAAAYIVGGKKLMPITKNQLVEVSSEITHMAQGVDYVLRNADNWYTHGGLVQGMTNQRQILGAGSGLGNNAYTLKLNLVNGFTRFGFSLQKIQHNPKALATSDNFFRLRDVFWNEWAYGINGRYRLGRFMLSGDIQFTRSKNYAWTRDNLRDNFYSYLQLSYLW